MAIKEKYQLNVIKHNKNYLRIMRVISKFDVQLVRLSRKIRNDVFYIKDEKYPYFVSNYNAINTERTVEIPWVKNILRQYESSEILEVGNVLSNYISFSHDIVDKYESGPGIINEDIVAFDTGKRYDLIITISTLEHIGFDEPQKESGKNVLAFENLKKLLKTGGKMVITVPLGYNPEIDEFIRINEEWFNEVHYLVRTSRFNYWVEANLGEALKRPYGSKYPAANAVALILFQK